MPIYVYSTLSNDQRYTSYSHRDGAAPQVDNSIFIAGKANVANKHLITPRGMVTEVTAEQLQALRRDLVFQQHVKNGFITISNAKADPEKIASGMTGRDESAPLVEQDFKPGEAPKGNQKNKNKSEEKD